MPGQLFTQYFLTDGIKTTPAWKRSEAEPAAFNAFRDEARQSCEVLSRAADPNEALTEQRLVRPLLEALGWTDYLPQQSLSPARPGSAARNEDIPDHLLFADAESRDRAAARKVSGRTLPRGAGRAGKQALRPAAGHAGLRRPRPTGHAARPNPALSGNRPHRLRRPHPLGHAHQRPRLASLRWPRPAARQRLLRGRPAGPAAAGPGRRPAGLPPAVLPRCLRAPPGRHPHLSGRRPGRRPALRRTGGARPLKCGLRARLPAARGGPCRGQRRQSGRRP